jgi:hypothetical protein
MLQVSDHVFHTHRVRAMKNIHTPQGYCMGDGVCLICCEACFRDGNCNANNLNPCTACPAGTTSPAGSTLPQHCVAPVTDFPGCPTSGSFKAACISCAQYGVFYFDLTASTCKPCDVNTYRIMGENAATCTSCPPGMTTSYNTVGFACSCQCVAYPCIGNCGCETPTQPQTCAAPCAAGTTGPDGGPCVACAAGTYKATAGTSNCRQCAWYLEDATGPVGSASRSNCICTAGHGYTGGPDVTNFGQCISCEPNAWSVEAPRDAAVCTCNTGYDTYVLSDSTIVTCRLPACIAGTTGPSGSCAACAIGTYKTVSGSEPCTSCAPLSTTFTTGSNSMSFCRCNAGYGGDASITPSTCTVCVIGRYKDDQGNFACLCPTPRTTLSIGSIASTSCECVLGYTGPV